MPDNDSYHFTLIRPKSAMKRHSSIPSSDVQASAPPRMVRNSVHRCFEAATSDVGRQLSAISSHSPPCSHGHSNIEGLVVRVSLGAAAVEGRVVRLVQRRVALQPLDQIWVG